MRKGGAFMGYALKPAFAWAPLAGLALWASAAPAQEAVNSGANKALGDLINTNCVECHNAEDWAGSLAFDTLDLAHVGEDPEVWEKTINKLRGRLMPPAGENQPGQADIDAFVSYLESSVDAAAKNRACRPCARSSASTAPSSRRR